MGKYLEIMLVFILQGQTIPLPLWKTASETIKKQKILQKQVGIMKCL